MEEYQNQGEHREEQDGARKPPAGQGEAVERASDDEPRYIPKKSKGALRSFFKPMVSGKPTQGDLFGKPRKGGK